MKSKREQCRPYFKRRHAMNHPLPLSRGKGRQSGLANVARPTGSPGSCAAGAATFARKAKAKAKERARVRQGARAPAEARGLGVHLHKNRLRQEMDMKAVMLRHGTEASEEQEGDAEMEEVNWDENQEEEE